MPIFCSDFSGSSESQYNASEPDVDKFIGRGQQPQTDLRDQLERERHVGLQHRDLPQREDRAGTAVRSELRDEAEPFGQLTTRARGECSDRPCGGDNHDPTENDVITSPRLLITAAEICGSPGIDVGESRSRV
jgi:hypothetical protein